MKTSDNPNSRFYQPRRDNANLWIGIAGVVVALFYGAWGIYLTQKSIDTSVDVAQFNRLLDKTEKLIAKNAELVALSTVQIDSLVSINKKLSKQTDIARDQYNLNADLANENVRKEAADKFNQFNNLVFAFAEMESIISYHRAERSGKMVLRTKNVHERIKALEKIQKSLVKINNIEDLLPGKSYDKMYSECLTKVMVYQLQCSDFIRESGLSVDTSVIGQKAYDTVMYRVIDLVDSVLPHIEEGRAKVKKDLDEINSVIKINNDIKTENQKKRKVKTI